MRNMWKTLRIHSVLHRNDGGVFLGGVQDETLAVLREGGRALGPKSPDLGKPSSYFSPKEPIFRVLPGPELLRKPAGSEERNTSALGVQRPRLPHEPELKDRARREHWREVRPPPVRRGSGAGRFRRKRRH